MHNKSLINAQYAQQIGVNLNKAIRLIGVYIGGLLVISIVCAAVGIILLPFIAFFIGVFS
jgi:hypothetical protein